MTISNGKDIMTSEHLENGRMPTQYEFDRSAAAFDPAPVRSTASATDAWIDRMAANARQRKGLVYVTVAVTPTIARTLLDRNPENRTISDTKVSDYATDMLRCAWRGDNGEPVIVSSCGLLNDGQHRLLAVVATNRIIEMTICFGAPRETRMTVDQGMVRTIGNYLKMEGVADGNNAGSVGALVWQYQAGGVLSRQTAQRPTKQQIREIVRSDPTIMESIRAIPSKGCALAGGKSVLAFCHWLFAKKDLDAANEFMERLMVGDQLSKKDPIYLCRTRLINNRKMSIGEKAELLMRAWNARRTGRPLTKLQLSGNLPHLED